MHRVVPAPPVTETAEDPRRLSLATAIRWMLWVGALVAAVSVVRLVASQWDSWLPLVQFGVLCVGHGVVGALGLLARGPLGLRRAGNALLGLFAACVPVLSWGASLQDLLNEPWGPLVIFTVLGLETLALSGLLRTFFGYRGWLLPGALGLYVLGFPAVSWLALPAIPVLGAGGVVLLLAARDLNRFFFHRDRMAGLERPLPVAPFLALVGLYAAGSLALLPGAAGGAVALTAIGAAFLSAGEEYARALERALSAGEPPRTPEAPVRAWPARSRALLASGFSALATAAAVGGLGADPLALWVSCGLGGARLATWAMRYRRTGAYALGLPLVIFGWHAFGAAFPELPKLWTSFTSALFRSAGVFEARSGSLSESLAGAALGELGWTLALAASSFWLRPRSSRGMRWVHGACVAAMASLSLGASWIDPAVVKAVAPALIAACALAAWGLRSFVPWLAGHGGVLALCLAISGVPAHEGLAVLSWANALGAALVVAASLALRRRGVRLENDSLLAGLCGPLLGLLPLVGWCSVVLLSSPEWRLLGLAGSGLAMSLLLAGGALRVRPAVAAATLGAMASSFSGLAGSVGLTLEASILLSLAWLFAGWALLALSTSGRASGWRRDTAASLGGAALGGAILTGSCSAVWALVAGGPALALHVPLWTGLLGADAVLRSRQRWAHRRSIVLALSLALASAAAVPACAILLSPSALVAPWTTPAALSLVFLASCLALEGLLRRLDPLGERVYPGAASLLAESRGELLQMAAGGAALSLVFFVGPWSLALAVLMTLLAWRERDSDRRRFVLPWELWSLALAGQMGLVTAHQTALTQVIAQGTWASLAPGAVAAMAVWLFVTQNLRPEARASRGAPWARGLEVACALALVFALGEAPERSISGGVADSLWIAYSAALMASRQAARTLGQGRGDRSAGWASLLAQAWLVLAAQGLWGSGLFSPTPLDLAYLALALAGALHLLSGSLASRGRSALAASLKPAQAILTLAAGSIPLAFPQNPVFLGLLPTFLTSLALALTSWPAESLPAAAGRRGARAEVALAPVLSSAALFVVGSMALVIRLPAAGPEFLCAGPGFALLALSLLLRSRVGRRGSQLLATCGATCLYAVPLVGMLAEVTWVWQATLLVMSIAFGLLSFSLKSRGLLAVSSLSVLANLAFSLLFIRRAAPDLMWVAGLFLGLALMLTAALLERRRERVLQQLRVWGHSLRSWA